MNQKIKFRVWDNKNKEMLYQPLADLEDLYISLLNGKIYQHGPFTKDMHETENRYEITQFTGFYDVYGKEVYVGDIIQDEKENKWINEKLKAIVRISNEKGYAGMFYYQYLPNDSHINPLDAFLYREPKENRREEISNSMFPLFKVIGNKFENPGTFE